MEKEFHEQNNIESQISLTADADLVIQSWVKSMELKDRDLLNQLEYKTNLFDDKNIENQVPEMNIEFWLGNGVSCPTGLKGTVLGKKGISLYRERINVSSELAISAAKKIKIGSSENDLTKSEKVSMLVLTKAKLLAAEKLALDVYPALRGEFENGKNEIDKVLGSYLVDVNNIRDADGRVSWNSLVPSGKARLPVFFTVATLVLAASTGGVSKGSISSENMNMLHGKVFASQGLKEAPLVVSTPETVVLNSEERESQTYLYDTKYGSEIYIYDEPWIQKELADFKEKYGISIVNPWNSVDIETGKKSLSEPWSPSEVAILIDEVARLPSEYLDQTDPFFPKSIVLFKIVGTQGTAGGFAAGDNLTFLIPSDFDLNKKEEGAVGLIFGNSEQFLRSVVDHEWTHNHQVNDPEFHSAWELEVGWTQDQSGNWINTSPDKYIGMIPGSGATDPQEDQASAVQIFRFSPEKLSESRRNFIIKSFPNWQPVIDFLEKDSKVK